MIETVNLNIDGNTISGEFAIPDSNAQKPFHTVCLCHGVPSGNKPDPADGGYPLLAETFRNHGFATFIFNFRGAGLSTGNFDINGTLTGVDAISMMLILEEMIK